MESKRVFFVAHMSSSTVSSKLLAWKQKVTPVDSLNSCKTVRICTQYTLPHKVAKQWSSLFLGVVSPFFFPSLLGVFLLPMIWGMYGSDMGTITLEYTNGGPKPKFRGKKTTKPGEFSDDAAKFPGPWTALWSKSGDQGDGFFWRGQKPIPKVEPEKKQGTLKRIHGRLPDLEVPFRTLGVSSRNQLWGGQSVPRGPGMVAESWGVWKRGWVFSRIWSPQIAGWSPQTWGFMYVCIYIYLCI